MYVIDMFSDKDRDFLNNSKPVSEGENWDKLTPQQKAHEYNLDAAQKEMDRRHEQGEDMSGAKIDKKTYKIVKPKQQGVAEASLASMRDYFSQSNDNTVDVDQNYARPQRKRPTAGIPPEIQALVNKMYHTGHIMPQELKMLQDFQRKTKINVGGQLNELFEPTLNYYTLSNGKMVQASYRPGVNQSPVPLTDVTVSYVDPALKPQGGSFDSTGVAEPWTKAPDGVKQAIEKFVAQPQKAVAEVTGDKPFDKMMTTIKQGTGKQKTSDRKEQQKQTQQRARDAFGNMFGGGNPADQLKIREQGVAEGSKVKKGSMISNH